MRIQRAGHRLRWPLALLAAAAVALLMPALAWAPFTQGPSVRVVANQSFEIRWVANFVGEGKVEIFDNPNGGTPIDSRTSPAAAGHTVTFSVGGILNADTNYFFQVTHKDPSNAIPDLRSDVLPVFTGAQAIGTVAVTPDTDSAVISWDANVIGLGRVEILSPAGPGPFDDSVNTTDHTIELTGLEPATTYEFRVSNRHAIDGDALATETGSFTTLSLTTFAADVQPPINADGSSTFNANRGVVPLRFTLSEDGSPTCNLPPATLRLTRTGGTSPGPIDESVYSGPSDSGSEFRIADCAYHYNVSAKALGPGTYLAEILIDGAVVGEARFELK